MWWSHDGEDETGKSYEYDCLAKGFESMETVSMIKMRYQTLVTK